MDNLQDCKKISRLYCSEEYKTFEKIIEKEIFDMVKRPNILTLFNAISNYFIMVGMKRILQVAEKMHSDWEKYQKTQVVKQ